MDRAVAGGSPSGVWRAAGRCFPSRYCGGRSPPSAGTQRRTAPGTVGKWCTTASGCRWQRSHWVFYVYSLMRCPTSCRCDLTMIMARKAKPMRTLSTWMSSMERGSLSSTVVLKPGIIPVMFAPDKQKPTTGFRPACSSRQQNVFNVRSEKLKQEQLESELTATIPFITPTVV